MFEKLLSILRGVTDKTTLEDARQVIADAAEEAEQIQNAVIALNKQIADLEKEITSSHDEISRLREANGRLFTERMRLDDAPPVKEDPMENKDEKIKKLMNELDY